MIYSCKFFGLAGRAGVDDVDGAAGATGRDRTYVCDRSTDRAAGATDRAAKSPVAGVAAGRARSTVADRAGAGDRTAGVTDCDRAGAGDRACDRACATGDGDFPTCSVPPPPVTTFYHSLLSLLY